MLAWLYLFIGLASISAGGIPSIPMLAGADLGGGDLTAVDEVAFSDAGAAASATGRLRRNGANITWHDGTAGRVVYRVAGTDVAVTDGGTGASDAPTALSNLGGQPVDATLTAYAGGVCGVDALLYCSGVDTVIATTLTAAGRALIDDVDAPTQRTTLGLGTAATANVGALAGEVITWAAGPAYPAGAGAAITGLQPADATLTALAGTGTAGDRGIYYTAADTAAEYIFTAAGRAVVDDASAAAQRTTLGVAIGSDVQGYDATLAAYAGGACAADALLYCNGADTVLATTLTAAGRAVLDDATAAAQRTTLGVAIGSDVEAYDATLAAYAGGACAADALLYCNGADTVAATTLTAAGRAVIDDATAAAQRTTLGVAIGSDVQAYDATLGALAGLTWAAATQAVVFTAADTVSFLTVGTAANNLVQLTGAGILPAVDGSALTGISAANLTLGNLSNYDTARASLELPFDWVWDVPQLSTGDWTIDTNWGATDALTAWGYYSTGNRMIRLTFTQGATNRGQGICRTIAASTDFTVATRISLAGDGINLGSLGGNVLFMFAFVDGQNLAAAGSDWFGIGVKYTNDTIGTADLGVWTGADWDTETSVINPANYSDTLDLWLSRVGNNITVYSARPGGGAKRTYQWVLGASNAGLICFRGNTIDPAAGQWWGLIHAYGSVSAPFGQ